MDVMAGFFVITAVVYNMMSLQVDIAKGKVGLRQAQPDKVLDSARGDINRNRTDNIIDYALAEVTNWLSKVDKRVMDDVWYVMVYVCFVGLFWVHRSGSRWAYVAFLVAVCRMVYNFLIMIRWIDFTPYQSTYLVPAGVLVILIAERLRDGVVKY